MCMAIQIGLAEWGISVLYEHIDLLATVGITSCKS